MKRRYSYSYFLQTPLTFVCLFTLLFFSCKTSQNTVAKESKENGAKRKLSSKERVDFDYVFFNGNKEEILKNYDLAETLFLQALKIDPNSAASMYELGRVYAFENNNTQALLYFKKAATLDPKNIWYLRTYAECLVQNKQPLDATIVYEKIIKDNPDKIDFYHDLATAYLYANKLNEAIKVYTKIETEIGVTEEASMQKLQIYKSTKNFDKAIEEAKKLIKNFPKEAKYYGILGELYQDKGMSDKALAAYNDLLTVDPTNAYVHLSLADYYRNQKQNDKAFNEIKIAFKSKDLDVDTKVKILLSYYDITEKYPELKPDADELCKIIVEIHPDEAKAFSIYGDFLNRDNKLEEARTQYRKAISLDKEKYALWNELLTIDYELNDYLSLSKESKEAMDLFPNQAAPYYFNGISNLQLKNYFDAIAALSEGKEFVFDNKLILAQFYAGIGDAQNQLKNHAASDSAYNKALEADPSSVDVLNNYSYYLSLRNINLEKAEAMSKKCNDLKPNVSSYQDTYGWILYQMKKYDDAKVWVGKALDNGGKNNGTLLEHYGDILYQLGDKDGALKYWIDAKKLRGASDLIDKKIADKKLYE